MSIYITVQEAAHLRGVTPDTMRAIIERDNIPVKLIRGEITVSAAKLKLRKEQRPEYKRHKLLAGHPISQKDAAEKYGVTIQTLRNWTRRGFIKELGRDQDDTRRVLLDEQDIAYCADVYRQRGGPSHRIFAEDGTPYTPRETAQAV